MANSPSANRGRRVSHLYYLVYRLPDGVLPELGFTEPTGGIVIHVRDADYIDRTVRERYHCAPWERIWFEDVSDYPAIYRKQCRRLHLQWDHDLRKWWELISETDE